MNDEQKKYDNFIFANSLVQLVLTLLMSMVVGVVLINHFGVQILSSESSLTVVGNFLLATLIGGIPVISLFLPFTTWLTEKFNERLYGLNEGKFDKLSTKASMSEHLLGVFSLFLVGILAFFYTLDPKPLALSVGLIASIPACYVWLLHLNREKAQISSPTQKRMYWANKGFTIFSFVLSLIACQFILNNADICSIKDIETKRMVNLFQYSEAVVLGFMAGWLSELLGKCLPK